MLLYFHRHISDISTLIQWRFVEMGDEGDRYHPHGYRGRNRRDLWEDGWNWRSGARGSCSGGDEWQWVFDEMTFWKVKPEIWEWFIGPIYGYISWLVVWNIFFSIYWEFHHPN